MRQYLLHACATLLTLMSSVVPANGTFFPCGQYEYVLKIKTPPTHEGPWIGYYQGTCIPFKGNLAWVCSSKMRFTFSLVITPALHSVPSPATRNMPILVRQKDAPVTWIDLSLVFKNGIWTWEQVTLTPEEMPMRLPDHALVFLFDPHLVKLASPLHTKYTKDPTYEGGRAIVEFPTIIINGSKKEIQEAAQKAYWASLDIRAFHEAVSCANRVIEGCCCSLVVP